MAGSRLTAHFSGDLGTRVSACVVTMIAVLALFPVQGRLLHGQSASPNGSATLQGSVRDPRGQAVAAAIVHLQGKSGSQLLIAHTDSAGTYRFTALRDGEYVVRAELTGYGEATSGSLVLGKDEIKTIDLTLESSKTAVADPAATQVEFFDEPSFTVAGVTDSTNLGGHGSNTIARTKETLAKDTVSLGRESHAVPSPVASLSALDKYLREAVARDPGNFEANQKLGKLLVAEGKGLEAIRYLERATQLNPSFYENAYQLALAYAGSGDYQRARSQVRTLLTTQDRGAQDTAELHHLLGEVEGNLGNPVEAVREYQLAAGLNPSELNLFDWGSELLIHRADQPAIEVFTKGNRLFPRSARMLLGLGAAWYASGSYEQAVQRFCDASDLNPADSTPYLFIGRLQSAETIPADRLVDKLERFVRLKPENALANYYYALTLWKKRKGPEDSENVVQVESLLQKAVHLDPKLGLGHLQLGILYSAQKDSRKAILAYQKAIEASPQMEEAHYRLAQIYKRTGENLKAQQELEVFDQLSKKRTEEVERERREIQQFVYKLRDPTAATQPQ
jgi:tetratricopeptide (TPR) repeat protein